MNPQTGGFTLFNPLSQELVTIGVLGVCAHHAPPLLTKSPDDAEDADACPAVTAFH